MWSFGSGRLSIGDSVLAFDLRAYLGMLPMVGGLCGVKRCLSWGSIGVRRGACMRGCQSMKHEEHGKQAEHGAWHVGGHDAAMSLIDWRGLSSALSVPVTLGSSVLA